MHHPALGRGYTTPQHPLPPSSQARDLICGLIHNYLVDKRPAEWIVPFILYSRGGHLDDLVAAHHRFFDRILDDFALWFRSMNVGAMGSGRGFAEIHVGPRCGIQTSERRVR